MAAARRPGGGRRDGPAPLRGGPAICSIVSFPFCFFASFSALLLFTAAFFPAGFCFFACRGCLLHNAATHCCKVPGKQSSIGETIRKEVTKMSLCMYQFKLAHIKKVQKPWPSPTVLM